MWTTPGFDAVIVAGGSGRRLGGVDKALLSVDGTPLLDRVLDAVAAAERIVVVGPRRPYVFASPSPDRVIWCREDPPGGGPVAGLAAGLLQVTASVVVVLAVDLPWIAPAVPVLRATQAARAVDAAVLVDTDGRRNYLAAAWGRLPLLNAVLALDQVGGASMRSLYEGVAVAEVPDGGAWGRDIDTPGDLASI